MNIGLLIALVGVLICQIVDAYSPNDNNQSKRKCRDFCKLKCGVNCNCDEGVEDESK